MATEQDVNYVPFPKLERAFVTARLDLTWSDLAWALRNGWLGARDVLALAGALAGADEELQVALALSSDGDDHLSLRGIIDAEAHAEGTARGVTQSRWLHVAVAWAYENRSLYDDPLWIVETIWEAFDHAPGISGLIRWMPATPGEPRGIDAIIDRWRRLSEAPPSAVAQQPTQAS